MHFCAHGHMLQFQIQRSWYIIRHTCFYLMDSCQVEWQVRHKLARTHKANMLLSLPCEARSEIFLLGLLEGSIFGVVPAVHVRFDMRCALLAIAAVDPCFQGHEDPYRAGAPPAFIAPLSYLSVGKCVVLW